MKDRALTAVLIIVALAVIGGLVIFNLPDKQGPQSTAAPATATPAAQAEDLSQLAADKAVTNSVVAAASEEAPPAAGKWDATLSLSGNVRTVDGQPVKGATVRVMRIKDMMRVMTLEMEQLGSTVSDASGRYQIDVEDQPAHFVQAVAEGYALDATSIMNEHWYQTIMSGGKLSGVRKVQQDFTLSPAAIVAGRVVTGGGAPIANAQVSIQPVKQVAQQGYTQPNIAARQVTKTDAEGKFIFAHAKAEEMMLGAAAENYLPAEQNFIPPQENLEIVLGSEGAFWRGVAYNQETGDVVSSATITLTRTMEPGVRPAEMMQYNVAVTNDAGEFRIGPLSEGSYTIGGEKERMRLLDRNNSSVLTVAAGERELTRDVYFYKGHTIVGKVTELGTDLPIEGVEVSVANPFVTPDRKNAEVPKDLTDAEGRFRITNVFGTNFGVNGQMMQATQISLKKDGYDRPAATNPWEQSHVPLPSDKFEVTYDIQLVKSLTVSGVVRYANGQPARGGKVGMETQYSFSRGENDLAPIKSDGTFTLPVKPMSTGSIRAIVPNSPDTFSALVEVRTEPVTGVEITIRKPGSIAGVVVDEKGKGVPNATVTAEYYAPIGKNMSRGVPSGESKTDAAGRFYINQVPSEQIRLKATAEGYAQSEVEVYHVKPEENRTDIRLTVREPHFLAGTVVNTEDKPVQNANVSVSAPGGGGYWNHAQTDAKGFFRIEGVPQLQLNLYINHQGDSQNFRDVHLDDEKQKFMIGTEVSATLIGTVIDAETRRPITDFEVKKIGGSGGGEPTKDPSAPGVFRWDKLKPNWYLALEITAPNYAAFRTESINVNAGDTIIEKTFELGVGGSITGRTIDVTSKQPIPNVEIVLLRDTNLYSNQDDPVQIVRTDAEGRFKIEKVNAGAARIRIIPAKPYTGKPMNVTVRNSQATDLGDIELGTGSVLTVVVTNSATGAPAPNVDVELKRGPNYVGQDAGKGTSDATGKVIFNGVSDEPHFLQMPSHGFYASFTRTPGDQEVRLKVGKSVLHATILRGGQPFDPRISMYSSIDGIGYNSIYTYEQSARVEAGKYDFGGLPGGNWTISLTVGDDWQNSQRHQILFGENEEINKTFTIPTGVIAGVVMDEQNKPVPDANVAYTYAGEEAQSNNITTDSAGKFKFQSMKAGTLKLEAHKTGIGYDGMDVTLAENETIDTIKLVLRKSGGSIVSSAFKYENGEPLQEAWVNIKTASGTVYQHSGNRDASGVMRIDFIPPGTYSVEVSYWGYSISTRTIEIKEGETVPIEDVLYRAGAVRWSVTLPSGSQQADYTLTPLDPQSIERVRSGKVRTGTEIVERGLWRGNYRGEIKLDDGRTFTETIEITEGELTTKQSSFQ